MEQNKFLKIFAFSAFVILMGVSCWATVESLHLLLPSWPVVFFWAVTVIFFVVSSIGTKLIVDSFNQRIRVDNRGWRLIGGIILLLIFWLCFSLPTNTHTFFYRSAIKDVLVQDLTDTKDKLQSLSNGGIAKSIIEQEKADFKNKINGLFANFAGEINNPGLEGWADRAEARIIDIERELGPLQRLQLRNNTHSGRQELIKAMRSIVDDKQLSHSITVYDTRLENINKGLNQDDIRKLITEIQRVQNKMHADPNNNEEPTARTSIILSQAYKIINNYSDILIKEFEKSHPDKIKLSQEDKKHFSGISETERMRSVVDVWKDFFSGKYAGRGFIFWVMLGALVDIAGFIFFDIAFAKREQ
ncbi:hypothetical protein M2459_000236 [Parabacteroides sp. PF5-5]|uniref:hypothetical protein n=1 Tax=unclassified Parabacteroides TaxID=2649774 RepID=UPI0024733CA9|nr:MULTISPECIES: hypothetical protein [unclassified Parabacteroides]MDH6303904.1 hypothetical protein [Parabacteroides sp. PH5-39]MDH6314521.1 hypothetical protein [Parabacteroides sp. PF5-13]MDH6318414.1 hypothetical protein [Parabacteroides sp. PH5-13]MDH6322293.1 hypothetical protein [Parabacteroides sp. PH5-8]MDH6325627.1 hypothetical protein [Parabacteroides sp. PH5-41]